tara:strand:- start:659 stop:796 length:138 start_codon:yes stop_codon:yes gene_type:complete
VQIDVKSADHLTLFEFKSSSLIKNIIIVPIRGKKIITESRGQLII